MARIEVPETKPGFQLNHRELPRSADIKFIWELSRWYELCRLAQAAWLLQETGYAEKCLSWLESWCEHNRPFRGWNWTSALESAMRLIQFTWIDSLLFNLGVEWNGHERLTNLRQKILAPHARFTWRYRSFGSSANNHLLGELAGLIVASARWPQLSRWCPDLTKLRQLWQKEVLAQFAPDGGNREQALNYQLFSWELCWHAKLALESAKEEIDSKVSERLETAADFYAALQMEHEHWDYGDSDDAFVVPLFLQQNDAANEWRQWITNSAQRPALNFWLGKRGSEVRNKALENGWHQYAKSGYLIYRSEDWFLRWDLSPLGYLAPASHGHLDFLHLSLWFEGKAILVDPGTGAYFGDLQVRNHLASAPVHNGPCPAIALLPERRGPFLWSHHHPRPLLNQLSQDPVSYAAELELGSNKVKRSLTHLPTQNGWLIEDSLTGTATGFTVLWQFAPEAQVVVLAKREFLVTRDKVQVRLVVDQNWDKIEVLQPQEKNIGKGTTIPEGTVSPYFRKIVQAPALKLTAATDRPCVFRTTFLGCKSG
ncbi:MAG TPA: heparinase II/III family protein [Verrucomicrobiae bacterium]